MNKEYFFISKPRCASTHIYEGLTNWNDKINGNKQYYHFTSKQMENILGEYGLELINPVGTEFDPKYHDALSHQVSEEVEEGERGDREENREGRQEEEDGIIRGVEEKRSWSMHPRKQQRWI